ncbi:MAG: energy transducer TonB [Blastocatellia bacterium]
MRLDDIVNHQQTAPPRIKLPSGVEFGASQGVVDGDQNGVPNGLGVIAFPTGEGRVNDAPPRPIDPPKAQTQTRVVDNKPLLVSSRVLQGKAIERVVPIYPELPKRIRLQGDVSIEVIISPNGQVESARVVSGHPMLINSALDAARRWRFEPTLLNNLPVRVTGVITFVFKVSD